MIGSIGDINWTLRKAPRIAWFLASQAVLRKLDRSLARQPRELDLADAVEKQATAGDPDSVIHVMDQFARTRRWLMSMGPDKGSVVSDLLCHPGIRHCLEIGTYCGYSAILAARQLKARSGHLVTLEISRRNAAVAKRIIHHAGLADVVEVRNQVLRDAISAFDVPFDLVLLDHWKNEYLPDLKSLESAGLLHAGSVVVADNVGFFKVVDYLDYVRHCGRYGSRYVPGSVEYNPQLPDGIEISVFHGNAGELR